MRNLLNILEDCFNKVNMENFVEVVPCVPNLKTPKYIQVWHIITEIQYKNMCVEIDLYAGIMKHFPYVLPDFYFLETKYDYFPHIDYSNRKLCLYEEEVLVDTAKPETIFIDCIRQARRLIEFGINRRNFIDFSEEICSYWKFAYNQEKEVNQCYYVYGNLPNEITILNLVTDYKRLGVIVSDENLEIVKQWHKGQTRNQKILYLPNLKIRKEPPFNLNWNILKCYLDENQLQSVFGFIKKTSTLNILFSLSNNTTYGGVLHNIDVHINGFRPHKLTPSQVIEKLHANKNLQRFVAGVYNKERIEERTSGVKQCNYKFGIVGLGSIGSNLSFFLNSYNNTSYVLVDGDIFRIDNIGRHILGINDIFNYKVNGVKRRLLMTKPSMIVDAIHKNVYDCSCDIFSDCSALFLCTGNLMAEYSLIERLEKQSIKIPKFILWFEPYGIAGHMIYLDKNSGLDKLKSLFTSDLRYIRNLIKEYEYNDPDKFLKRDAGCNGSYTNYSGNDVTLFLSSMYPHICNLLGSNEILKCYRWVGNINLAKENGIELSEVGLVKNQVNIW